MLRATCLVRLHNSASRTPSAHAAFDRRSAVRLLLFFAVLGFGFGDSHSSGVRGHNRGAADREFPSRRCLATSASIRTVFRCRVPNCRYSLLVSGASTDGRTVDLTRAALYRSKNASIVEIGPDGVAQSVADGDTEIEVTIGREKQIVPVRVAGSHVPRSLHFENDILPILSRFGCNSSGCHGKAEGQNGFKLSIFGFDPHADRLALLEEGRGRRIFPAAPEESLILKKASASIPHGGGLRIQKASPEYRLLRDWIAEGAPEGDPAAPHVVSIQVTPRERQMRSHEAQQLRVVARYSDGHEVDVTRHAKFQSNHDELVQVDNFGLVTAGEHPGEAAVMAAYMGAVDVFRALVPLELSPSNRQLEQAKKLPQYNFIDPPGRREARATEYRPLAALQR